MPYYLTEYDILLYATYLPSNKSSKKNEQDMVGK